MKSYRKELWFMIQSRFAFAFVSALFCMMRSSIGFAEGIAVGTIASKDIPSGCGCHYKLPAQKGWKSLIASGDFDGKTLWMKIDKRGRRFRAVGPLPKLELLEAKRGVTFQRSFLDEEDKDIAVLIRHAVRKPNPFEGEVVGLEATVRVKVGERSRVLMVEGECGC